MSLKLIELQADSEFDEIVRVEFDAYENPDCRLKNLFFPMSGGGADARELAIKQAVERQTGWHRADPTSHWIKVIDAATDKVLGAACWHIYDQDPYAVESEEGCDWFTKGQARDIANSLMEQFLTPRMTYMRKPHIFLDICFTHPEARRRGVGKLLMDWGVAEADKRSYEAYIDATDLGRALYRTYGFVEGKPIEFSTAQFARTNELRSLEEQLLPFVWWPMYRPAKDEKQEGKVSVPWESL